MSKKTNVILGITAGVMAAALAVGATVAYMTDSETKTNTFTVGNLDVTLTESEWDNTVDGLDMYPGYQTAKNPTVTEVDHDSYMRVRVTFQSGDSQPMTAARVAKIMETIYTGTVNDVNTAFTKDTTRSTDTVFVYNYTAGTGIFTEGSTATLFDTVKIPTAWNQNDLDVLGKYSITITVEAIQAQGFTSASYAYSALDAEASANTLQVNHDTVNGI